MSKPKNMTPEMESAWHEKQRARNAARYQENKEQYKEKFAKWRAENKEKMREYSRAYKQRHPDRVAESMIKHVKNNHEKILARSAAHYKKMMQEAPDVLRAQRALIAQNRRAKKQNTCGKISYGRITRLMKLQKGKCAVCCCNLIETGKHIDHIMPLALGGSHDDQNIQLLCPTCNLTKSAKHPVDFMQSRGFLL